MNLNPDEPAIGGGEPIGLGATPKKKKVDAHVAIIAVIVVVSGGLLLGMRQLGLGPAESSAATEFDTDLGKKLQASAEEFDALVSQLDRSTKPVQVPSERVERDPFRLALLDVPDPDAEPSNEAMAERAAEIARQRAEERRQEIRDGLAALRVQSVIGGSVPLARISGATYRLGDTIDEMFTIVRINGRLVGVEADGELYAVTLGGEVLGPLGQESD